MTRTLLATAAICGLGFGSAAAQNAGASVALADRTQADSGRLSVFERGTSHRLVAADLDALAVLGDPRYKWPTAGSAGALAGADGRTFVLPAPREDMRLDDEFFYQHGSEARPSRDAAFRIATRDESRTGWGITDDHNVEIDFAGVGAGVGAEITYRFN